MAHSATLTERQRRSIADLTEAAADLITIAVAINRSRSFDADHPTEAISNREVLALRLEQMRAAIADIERVAGLAAPPDNVTPLRRK